MTTLRTLLRKLANDIGEEVNDYHTYLTATAAGRTWTLSEENPISSTIVVYVNNVAISASYLTYDSTTNRLVISATPLTLNDEVRISFNAYKKYSDDELDAYIEQAFTWLSIKKYQDFYNDSGTIYPTPTLSEKRLVCLIAAVLMKGNLVSYKTKEFSVEFNKDTTPEQKIDKLLSDYSKCMGIFDWIEQDYVI